MLALLGIAAGLVVPSAAAVSPDQQLAEALVVPHRGLPSYWNAAIEPTSCTLTTYPAQVQVTAHAATRWGSPAHGLWSAAAVATSTAQARVEFAHVADVLPGCVGAWFRRASRQRVYATQVTTAPLSYHNRHANELRAWKVTQTIRTPDERIVGRVSLDVVAARVGRCRLVPAGRG
jgi:hypothetical protein